MDKGSFAAIVTVLMLMPIVSHAGGLGVAPLIFILGVLGLLSALKTKRFQITPVQIALVIFLTWLCITALWSPYKPDDLLTNYLKLFLMAMIFYWSTILFESTANHRPLQLQNLFMAASFFGAGLLIVDLLNQFGITFLFNPTDNADEKIFRRIDAEMNVGHAITVLVLLAAPVVCLVHNCLSNRIAPAVIVLFLLFIAWGAWLNGLVVGLLGIAAVIAAALAAYIYPRRVPNVLLALAIVLIMAAPILAFISSEMTSAELTKLPLSWEHRLRMWGYCWQVIVDNPVHGAGFDASRTFNDTFIARDGREITTVSLHPHNAGIQIWTEVGFIGALLASTVIATLFKPVKRFSKNKSHAAAVSGVIIATIIISSLTYGAWQFWWWGCVFFAIGTLHFLPNSEDSIPLE